ncbi:vWA domain-containing protein [Pseudomarimonas salicorniae]|uniref:VWA domain-containing protein n=1 Tax=Pseudomarimonas salicorniae TaxID=2933270 RepID=A0ABT0GHT4_9GAMM|nr:VWA domain-containing protein [Lysobacter sp. CAU 1642]MCK7594098.1 VWA domain-containing protein [Lysobacter sp. CAU 1642]
MKAMAWGAVLLAVGAMTGCGSEVREEPAREEAGRADLGRQQAAKSMPAPPPPAAPALQEMAAPPMPASITVTGSRVMADEAGSSVHHAEFRSNAWQASREQPVSTFSIDVDTGSYTLARRMLREGRIPPREAVRTEEFLNYFEHGYTPPSRLDPPFSITTELAPAPWNAGRTLLQVGLKGYEVDQRDLPPANLVFLIDTSGSMQAPDKLPLLKQGFRTLVQQLRPQDRVAIVTYAGSAGLVLPSTPGDDRHTILAALDQLEAGGSTHGSAGIELAYRVAAQSLAQGGINRVILATDGDFNVGTTSVEALKAMVAERREGGIALTTLGFGGHGYNDEIAEQLADVGDGHHAYIDDALEARRVLVSEMGGTLLTIAKDVKVQVEFNGQAVERYRLVGYENRLLAREEFHDDRVDAGEIGAGHDVTALYELELREGVAPGATLASLRLRYKKPDEKHSRLIERGIERRELKAAPGPRLAFAAAVAGFAEKLRGNADLADYGHADLLRLLDQSDLAKHGEDGRELRDLIELSGGASVSID